MCVCVWSIDSNNPTFGSLTQINSNFWLLFLIIQHFNIIFSFWTVRPVTCWSCKINFLSFLPLVHASFPSLHFRFFSLLSVFMCVEKVGTFEEVLLGVENGVKKRWNSGLIELKLWKWFVDWKRNLNLVCGMWIAGGNSWRWWWILGGNWKRTFSPPFIFVFLSFLPNSFSFHNEPPSSFLLPSFLRRANISTLNYRRLLFVASLFARRHKPAPPLRLSSTYPFFVASTNHHRFHYLRTTTRRDEDEGRRTKMMNEKWRSWDNEDELRSQDDWISYVI